jgi:hypothetical protein
MPMDAGPNLLVSLPGLTRQSIRFERVLRRLMDARVKPAHDEFWAPTTPSVMAGFNPAIHVFGSTAKKDVDARDRPGHDE